jgi:hypothetical protein
MTATTAGIEKNERHSRGELGILCPIISRKIFTRFCKTGIAENSIRHCSKGLNVTRNQKIKNTWIAFSFIEISFFQIKNTTMMCIIDSHRIHQILERDDRATNHDDQWGEHCWHISSEMYHNSFWLTSNNKMMRSEIILMTTVRPSESLCNYQKQLFMFVLKQIITHQLSQCIKNMRQWIESLLINKMFNHLIMFKHTWRHNGKRSMTAMRSGLQSIPLSAHTPSHGNGPPFKLWMRDLRRWFVAVQKNDYNDAFWSTINSAVGTHTVPLQFRRHSNLPANRVHYDHINSPHWPEFDRKPIKNSWGSPVLDFGCQAVTENQQHQLRRCLDDNWIASSRTQATEKGREGDLSTREFECRSRHAGGRQFWQVHIPFHSSLWKRISNETNVSDLSNVNQESLKSQTGLSLWPVTLTHLTAHRIEKVDMNILALNCPSPFVNLDQTSCPDISEFMRLILPVLGFAIAYEK